MSPHTAPTTAALARLRLPEPALYVTVGAAGSGKSSIAAAFPRAWRLSLDDCREQVCGDAGDQSATTDALRVFDAVLNGRLARRLPTIVDNTNLHATHRISLIDRAHAHRLPVVAIVARTPLALCQARQVPRPASRQVPADVVTWQHQNVPSREQLLTERFDQVRDADQLDLLRMVLERSTAAASDPYDAVRAAFGDLADLFTFTAADHSTGVFAVAGRELVIRRLDDGDPFDHHWQARLDLCPDGCGGTRWARVNDATDLLDAHQGGEPDEAVCDICDAVVMTGSPW
ncbi:AAA family ATPase [Streptomyces uncialis]|uniref:AAA family ATPase n=1 Tax=Streptomyces uncialis TaxID=1048205 RepID=UPI002F93B48B|nr:AAA family ATPase [Streptomyces uncialis]